MSGLPASAMHIPPSLFRRMGEVGTATAAHSDVRLSSKSGGIADIAPCLKMGWTGRAPAPNRSENERGA
jgi:hypothetical protein